jgi:hypothetical protein
MEVHCLKIRVSISHQDQDRKRIPRFARPKFHFASNRVYIKKIAPFLRPYVHIYSATLSGKFRKIVWEFIQDDITDF